MNQESTTMHRDQQPCDRRHWLRASARYAALCGLTVVTGYLLLRPTNTPCGRNLACGECDELAKCDLPGAVVTRKPIGSPGRAQPTP